MRRLPAPSTPVAVAAGAAGAVLVFLSWGPLQYVFADYLDNSLTFYVTAGLCLLLPGLALLAYAVTSLARPSRSRPAGRDRAADS